jgi:hypothetical protein
MSDEFAPPPVDLPPDEIVEPASSWPKVIGILSIVYASLGLLAVTCGGSWMLLLPMMPKFMGGGTSAPTVLLATTIGSSLVGICLGILLMSGGIKLVRYRREGVKRLKTWAIARLAWAIVAMGLAIVTMPTQIQFQREMQKQQMEAINSGGGPAPAFGMPSEEQQWTMAIISTVVIGVLTLVYPLFLGVFLSRRRITDEVQRWP